MPYLRRNMCIYAISICLFIYSSSCSIGNICKCKKAVSNTQCVISSIEHKNAFYIICYASVDMLWCWLEKWFAYKVKTYKEKEFFVGDWWEDYDFQRINCMLCVLYGDVNVVSLLSYTTVFVFVIFTVSDGKLGNYFS